MPSISDQPPSNIQAELNSLRAALDQNIPQKQQNQNLLIATWNIRMFGSLTRKWTAGSNDKPKRDLRGLRAICEIIRRFDVIAVQEVMGNLRALRDMMHFLGENWSFLMTDITIGKAGNKERMAFVFDITRVQPSGLACELVIPPEWLSEIGEDALKRQFARTPYAVSFRANSQTFILATLHIDYGDSSSERIPELRAIARWMYDWANRTNRWHHNLLTLGDFNVDRKDDDLWKALTSRGLTIPDDLHGVPRTIFADPDNPTLDRYYDQIAWFEGSRRARKLSMEYLGGGYFDFLPFVYRETNMSKRSISYRISDHYTLWAEFSVS